jgi:hypothetical protein
MYHEHMNTGLNNQVKIRTEHATFTRMETKKPTTCEGSITCLTNIPKEGLLRFQVHETK